MVRVLNSGPRGRVFDSQPVRYQVTLWASCSHLRTCVGACGLVHGLCRLVTFRLRLDSHCWSFASNLEQVAQRTVCSGQLSLLPAAGREMSSSLWVMGWRHTLAEWGGVMSASCNRVSNCSLMQAIDGCIVRCGVISSCQSPATSEIVKRFWSRVWLM